MIYIDMDMPKNCKQCRLREGEYCPYLNTDIDLFYEGEIRRHKDCPLRDKKVGQWIVKERQQLEVVDQEIANKYVEDYKAPSQLYIYNVKKHKKFNRYYCPYCNEWQSIPTNICCNCGAELTYVEE